MAEKKIKLCGGKGCCPTLSVEGENIIIADGDSVIKLNKEAADKLREAIIMDFLKYLIMEWLTEHGNRLIIEEIYENTDGLSGTFDY